MDTPRTDAVAFCAYVEEITETPDGDYVAAEFARELERELNALRAMQPQIEGDTVVLRWKGHSGIVDQLQELINTGTAANNNAQDE